MTSSEDISKALPDSFDIRPANVDDLPFIYSTWLKNLYYGCPFYRDVDRKTYFSSYKHIVTGLLSRATVKVCCLKEEPEVVLGYSVHEGEILHWVYVKKAWRGLRIASCLVPPNIAWVSHLTNIGKKLKPKDWKFDPFVGT